MNEFSPVSCLQFDQEADDLVLGHIGEPERSRLIGHAASCEQCRMLIDGLGAVADRLLLLAPRIDPPAGFEARVLARVSPPTSAISSAGARVPLWAAIVAVLIMGVTGFMSANWLDEPSGLVAAPSAVIRATGGADMGLVQLVASPTPHVIVSITSRSPRPGIRLCELQRSDGSWARVGSWDVADISGGVWATGIDPTLLKSGSMRIMTEDGTMLARATFG